MRRKTFTYFLILALGISASKAQEILVRAVLDTNRALIGDQLKLNIEVEKSGDWQVNFPALNDTLSEKVEIIAVSAIDTTPMGSGRVKLTREVLVTVFDTGFYEIPPLHFMLTSGLHRDTLKSLPVFFEIVSVKVDSALHDIKAIERMPLRAMEVLPYPVAALVLFLLTWVIIHYIKKWRKRSVRTQAGVPDEPAHVIALRELEKLKEEKPWQHNRVKYYYSRISEILRAYIEQRFQIPALEQTTHEIVQIIRVPMVGAAASQNLAAILQLSDLVKFAKVIPDAGESAVQLTKAVAFVTDTMMSEKIQTDEAPGEMIISNNNQVLQHD
ncbi:MAG: hypothetical protein JXQ80_08925 [Bacteroidales bacterium]|nr:hypothetical protein [Bacteroidales bacterium]